MDKSGLLDFLSAEGNDPNGRHMANCVAAYDDELENTHDLFQWVFSLKNQVKQLPIPQYYPKKI